MYKYIEKHERLLVSQIENPTISVEKTMMLHERQIKWLQHERSSHLLVTIAVSVCVLFFLWLFLTTDLIMAGLLLFITIVMCLFYLIHYFKLENAVQRWYNLYLRLWLLAEKEGKDHEIS